MTESENGKTLEENTKTTNTEPMAECMYNFLVTWIVGLTIFPFGSWKDNWVRVEFTEIRSSLIIYVSDADFLS